ncbi:four helix bundle protein [Acidaminococcus timonensis]|jgi:four helix bundle protein|uniref:four helix bundle protein n=1 Tax=Acidaminococcus timonensis TaxID=1871002 RepID=UPI0025CE34B0|nr:four helix bundle protein [Acidaminococcus timonensis]
MDYPHKQLFVWQKGMELANFIYSITEDYPARERYSMADQMRRAAVSIPSNIAEGRTRGSDKEFVRFLLISRGSCAELDTQLLLSQARGYISENEANKACFLCEGVSRGLTKLIQSLKPKM